MHTRFEIDLSQIPFSRAFSYMALSKLPENWRGYGNNEGIFLKNISGSAPDPLIAEITFGSEEVKKDEIEHVCMENTVLSLESVKIKYECVFADKETLLIRTDGKSSGMTLDFITESGPYDYIYELKNNGINCFVANCYKNNCSYVVWAQKGRICLDQKWEEQSSLYSKLHVSGEDGFFLVIKEVASEWDRVCQVYDFDMCALKTDREFFDFADKYPKLPDEYRETALLAAYVNWSAYVSRRGFLTRNAMLMSKNHMCSIWSWDNCFNALALSYFNPEAAWEQYMIIFDVQDASGRIPDSINDSNIIWNYCKPPIHGWTLKKLMLNMDISRERLEEVFEKLEKHTLWWMNYRDFDKNGLYEYCHGNDSGWDNSTVFAAEPPIEAPDLQAFLVIQMETLADICDKLGIIEKSVKWRTESNELLKRFVENNFYDNMPAAYQSSTRNMVKNESLLPYMCLILGERLPQDCRIKMIEQLKVKGFLTEYGFATENPASAYYRSDGYWRGPVWAPSTVLLLDGLAECGEYELAKTAAERFIKMAKKSGFAENYDALTGEGLRDRAYSWTASSFFILAREYL